MYFSLSPYFDFILFWICLDLKLRQKTVARTSVYDIFIPSIFMCDDLITCWIRDFDEVNSFQFIGQWQFLFVRDVQRDIVSFRRALVMPFSDCSWLENRATGLKNLGWEPLTSRKCPPILVPFPPYRDVLLLRHANEECFMRRISFLTFYICVQYVIDFFMSHVIGIKTCNAIALVLLFESVARLYAFRNGLIVFSLFHACIKACSALIYLVWYSSTR